MIRRGRESGDEEGEREGEVGGRGAGRRILTREYCTCTVFPQINAGPV